MQVLNAIDICNGVFLYSKANTSGNMHVMIPCER